MVGRKSGGLAGHGEVSRRYSDGKRFPLPGFAPAAISPLFPPAVQDYLLRMKLMAGPTRNLARIAIAAAAIAAATGAAFAAWVDQGAGIFLTMVESGLAWCF